MSERVPSDHPAVETFRATLERSGGTRRPSLRLPEGVSLDPDDDVRLVLDGTPRHARVVGDADGLVIRHAADNRRLARSPGEGENRLVEWCERNDRGPGDAVELDELDSGFFYGLRVPGKRAVYDVLDRPNESLSAIAEQLDGDRS